MPGEHAMLSILTDAELINRPIDCIRSISCNWFHVNQIINILIKWYVLCRQQCYCRTRDWIRFPGTVAIGSGFQEPIQDPSTRIAYRVLKTLLFSYESPLSSRTNFDYVISFFQNNSAYSISSSSVRMNSVIASVGILLFISSI